MSATTGPIATSGATEGRLYLRRLDLAAVAAGDSEANREYQALVRRGAVPARRRVRHEHGLRGQHVADLSEAVHDQRRAG